MEETTLGVPASSKSAILPVDWENAAYSEAIYSQTTFRMSDSLFEVSSKPGVSTKTTSLPSISKGFDSSTRSVHETRLLLTRKSESLARLINYHVIGEQHTRQPPSCELTVDLPTPVGPMTLRLTH